MGWAQAPKPVASLFPYPKEQKVSQKINQFVVFSYNRGFSNGQIMFELSPSEVRMHQRVPGPGGTKMVHNVKLAQASLGCLLFSGRLQFQRLLSPSYPLVKRGINESAEPGGVNFVNSYQLRILWVPKYCNSKPKRHPTQCYVRFGCTGIRFWKQISIINVQISSLPNGTVSRYICCGKLPSADSSNEVCRSLYVSDEVMNF